MTSRILVSAAVLAGTLIVRVDGSAVARPPFQSVPRAAVPARAVDDLRRSAAAYVERFTSTVANVVVEERYTQNVLAGGSLLARNTPEAGSPRHRELGSDLLLVETGGPLRWQVFRDVFEVDGKPVRDREERLTRLFEQPAREALDQAARIARESARYNIGAVERTLNTPVLALLFLQADLQPRFAFSADEGAAGFSDRVDVLAFHEQARPTIIRTVSDTDRPASGRFWIDRETGTVLQTELVLTGEGISVRFTTVFRHDAAFGVAVPARMHEVYDLPSGRLTGVATYSGFRRFRVTTDTSVSAPEGGQP